MRVDIVQILLFIQRVDTLKQLYIKRVLTRIERARINISDEDSRLIRKIILDGFNDLVREIYTTVGYRIEK